MNRDTSNGGKKWNNNEVSILIEEYCDREEDIIYISEILRRTPKSIACKLVHLDKVENKELTRGYSQYYKTKNRERSNTFNNFKNKSNNIKENNNRNNNENIKENNNQRRYSSYTDDYTLKLLKEMMNKIDKLHLEVEEMKQAMNK